jgi:hypothetical protein
MITYSVSATVTRATAFNRTEFRKMGMSSGEASREFSASVDLTVTPLPTFPILINTADITHIRFLGIQVTGGTALIRLSQSEQVYNNIDLPIEGSMLLSGCDLSQVVVLGTPSGQCFIEFFGMGN